MDKDLGSQDPLTPEEEDNDSTIVEPEGETDEKLTKLEEANKKLFARAKQAEEELKAIKQTPKEEAKPEISDLDKVIEEKINERDLSSMDLSDDLKSEVKAYAKAKGVSYREVLKTPYFNFIKGQEEERTKSEEASASNKNKTTKASRDFASMGEGEIKNLSDEEFDQYKSWLKSQ